MSLISIDLGSTNVKVMAYDHSFKKIWQGSRAVEYDRSGKFVEFDAEVYFDDLAQMLSAKRACRLSMVLSVANMVNCMT